MFDLRWIRENPLEFDAGLIKRGLCGESDKILKLDVDHRECLVKLHADQSQRNQVSKKIGLMRAKGEDASELIADVSVLKARIREGEERERELAAALDTILSSLPNMPAADVPEGVDESFNVEVARWGEAPKFDFAPREHFEIGEALGLMDFDTAAKLSGSRFVMLKGLLAKMERALAAFMLDLHTTRFGYVEVAPPLLVRGDVAYGTGNLPKFSGDLFHTTDDYWLIPTAEMPLTNIVRETILDAKELPLCFTAYTPCFRSEAGAAGKDTRGMIRQHQFSKVELVSITHPDSSNDQLEYMRSAVEEVLRELGIHYRVVKLSAGDLGFSARMTYDIEVWLPGQETYREISSCSNCGDFQARRMNARFRDSGDTHTRFVHSLNASGLAVGRTLVAILENMQRKDGSVAVPEVLRPYMGGVSTLECRAG
tara:strand:- start:375 stop:1655 length:1281 start_codon:yes stop_codon:yes gene_type:complete